MPQLSQLKSNEWVSRYGGPWGSMIVLAQKPHQEDIKNIEDFIWRMCVSYLHLNGVTKIFQFPISRCDDAIIILGDGAGKIWIISLDARQYYYQVLLREADRKKLAFFALDDRKYTFNVMPIGPTNAPPFYTTMIKDLKDEWDKLFSIRLLALKTFNSVAIILTGAYVITIGTKTLGYGIKVIIGDILLWCNVKTLVIIYFRCVFEI